MKYASVCSGVEAASLAWMPLGWEAAWFSEIEPFPCAVLKERFPNVPNLGDMTKIQVENMENGDQKFIGGDGTTCFIPGGVDLLVGGTPCQSFSVAGKREGLEGASGLAEHFVRLLREMRPRWFVWENVPGALSSRTRGQFDFNFLVNEYAKCGYACGWRVLDAQYVRVDGYPRAVPQRRRRVFVVGHSSADWRYPASVLFEPDSLFGDTPPRRIKRKGVAGDAEDRAGTASVIRMRAGKPGGGKGALVSEETSLTLQAGGNDQTVVSLAAGQAGELGCIGEEVSQTLSRNNGGFSYVAGFDGNMGAKAGNIGYAEEECPRRYVPARGGAEIVCASVASTLNAHYGDKMGLENQHINEGCPLFVVHGSQTPISNSEHTNALGTCNAGLENCVCYDARGNGDGKTANTVTGDHADRVTDYTPIVASNESVTVQKESVRHDSCATVRRLLVVECERLMGFPDDWTRIPWKGKPEADCPDSPRYKACGNSMCVNVMRWIGMRIELVERKMK